MDILWIFIIVLFVCWLAGLGFGVGGGLIHILLVIAVIVLVFRIISGSRSI
jgi:hypothetical protein